MDNEDYSNNYETTEISKVFKAEESYSGYITLDYAESDNAVEIDLGIRETIRGIRVSILAMGLALANMKTKKLYRDLGFAKLSQYVQRLSIETKMDKSNIHVWLRIGEAYIRHQNDLEQIGFDDSDGPTKLTCLDRALENNEKHDVFVNIKNMSVREFKSYSKGEARTDLTAYKGPGWKVDIKGNSIYIDGRLAVILSQKTDPRIYGYFTKVMRIACEGLEKEGAILPVFMRSMREAKRFSPAVERLKTEMGLKR